MSFLRKAVNATVGVTTAAVSTTKSAVSSTTSAVSSAIHNPGKEDYTRDWSNRLDPVPSLYSVYRGALKFRFASSKGKVLIYKQWDVDDINNQISLLEYNEYGYVMSRVRCADYRYVQYKEQVIRHHTYTEIIGFIKKYMSNNRAHWLNSKRREFAIRLAEFCRVSINEIDGQITLGLKAASQLYTVNDTIKDVTKGIGQIVIDKKPIRGTAHVIGSIAQNTAKFGVATVKSVSNQNVSDIPNTVWYGNYQDDEKYIYRTNVNDNNNNNNNNNDNDSTDDKGGIASTNAVIGGNIEGDDCPICYENGKSHAMQCGHILCWDCIQKVDECPFCKEKKKGVVKLFNLKDDD